MLWLRDAGCPCEARPDRVQIPKKTPGSRYRVEAGHDVRHAGHRGLRAGEGPGLSTTLRHATQRLARCAAAKSVECVPRHILRLILWLLGSLLLLRWLLGFHPAVRLGFLHGQ